MKRNQWFVSGFGLVSSILGGVGVIVGGLWLGLVVSLAVAVGAWAYFSFIANKATGAAAIASAPVSVTDDIPADRIDALTSLPNENGLAVWFAENQKRLADLGRQFIVLTAEWDDFEEAQRTKGVEITNLVLKALALRISSSVGIDGVAARTSANEFVAVLTVGKGATPDMVSDQAGKITEMLQRPAELDAGVVWIGGPVGAATGSPMQGSVLLGQSRQALVKARRLGKGHFVVYGS
jgi:GGDEF domain-containing protein